MCLFVVGRGGAADASGCHVAVAAMNVNETCKNIGNMSFQGNIRLNFEGTAFMHYIHQNLLSSSIH